MAEHLFVGGSLDGEVRNFDSPCAHYEFPIQTKFGIGIESYRRQTSWLNGQPVFKYIAEGARIPEIGAIMDQIDRNSRGQGEPEK